MASAITYNGVEGAEGGNIFKDVKFWVAMRIPTRNSILDQIKNNGGTVVPLEKQADILIADHARKDAPPGSYSWKFITDSIENGIIQIKDRYRIGRDPELPRPAGARGATKFTRTPFTPQEDAALLKYVLEHSLDRTGNKIYQDYELLNPQHTWQSWRNRYVKTLRLLPMEQQERMAASVPDEPPRNNNNVANNIPPSQQEAAARRSPRKPSGFEDRTASNPSDRRNNSPTLSRTTTRETLREPTPPVQGRTGSKEAGDVAESGQELEEDFGRGEQASAQYPPNASDFGESAKLDAEKQAFYEDLSTFIEANEIDIPLQPEFYGKKVELWDLSIAVGAQEVAPADVNWFEVAEYLDLDWQEDLSVLEDLEKCYREVILDFLDAMKELVEEKELDEPEIAEAGCRSTPIYIRSSPPVEFVTKRPLDQSAISSSRPAKKRVRYHRDLEIPSTPEEKIGVVRRQYASPSLRRGILRQEYNQDSEASQQLPVLPGAQREGRIDSIPLESLAEPSQPPRLQQEESACDITPSQQLENESLDPSPIPFALNKRHADKGKSTASTSSRQPLQQSDPRRRHQEAKSGNSQLTSSPIKQKAKKRRSLPWSFHSSSRMPPRSISSAPPVHQETSPSDKNKKEIDECVERYQSLGYPRHIVVEGLKRTTMTPGFLAGLVMENLRNGKGVPSHHEGIWTDRDDNDLRLVNSVDPDVQPSNPQEARQKQKAKKASDRLIHKHGLAGVELRRKFLEAYTQQGEGPEGK